MNLYQRVSHELAVLRFIRNVLPTIITDDAREPKFFRNKVDATIVALSAGRLPMTAIAQFLEALSVKLGEEHLGVALDTAQLKSVNGDPKEHAHKKTLFLNFVFSTFTRESLLAAAKVLAPEDEFYSFDVLEKALVQVESDLVTAQRYAASEAPRKVSQPVLTADHVLGLLQKMGLGDSIPQMQSEMAALQKGGKRS